LTRNLIIQDDDDECDDGSDSGDEENLHELADEQRPKQLSDILVYAVPPQPKASDKVPADHQELVSPVKVKPLVGHLLLGLFECR